MAEASQPTFPKSRVFGKTATHRKRSNRKKKSLSDDEISLIPNNSQETTTRPISVVETEVNAVPEMTSHLRHEDEPATQTIKQKWRENEASAEYVSLQITDCSVDGINGSLTELDISKETTGEYNCGIVNICCSRKEPPLATTDRCPTDEAITFKPLSVGKENFNTIQENKLGNNSNASKQRKQKNRKRKTNKKSVQLDIITEEESFVPSTSRNSETIEILEKDPDKIKVAKKEKRKQRKKKTKRIVKKAGLTVWKGIRETCKLMWSGLAMYTLPLGSLDVSTNITRIMRSTTTT